MNPASLFIIGACLLVTATATAIPFPGPNQPAALTPGIPTPLLILGQPQIIQDEQSLTPVTREKRENERVVFNDDSGLPASTPCRNCGVSRIEYTEPASSSVRTCRTCGGGNSVSRIEYSEPIRTSSCRNGDCGGGNSVSRIEYSEPIRTSSCRNGNCGGGTVYYPASIPVRQEVYSYGCRGGNCGGTTYYPSTVRTQTYSYGGGCRGGNCGTSYYPVRSGGYTTTCRNC